MSLSALISGFFYLVFGRLASAPGCTISGMTEFWAQQAVDVSIVIVALAVLASIYNKNLWMRHRHWIQTNMAPVFGIILFLPLLFTVASQIIWRFRSSEFAYCWIPRHPVYARWVAIEGWRTLIVLGLILAYLRIVFTIRNSKHNPKLQISWPMTETRKSKRRYSAIDSGMVSRVTNDPRGLFSQSMYNINRWARSKIGRANNINNVSTAQGLTGLRTDSQNYSHPMGDNSFYKVHYLSDNNITSENSSTSAVFYTGRHRNSTTLSVVKGPSKNYYEQFKRSFVNNFVRRFIITTDIPSPTIAQSIFDRIAKNPHECTDPTICNYCHSSETAYQTDSKLVSADGLGMPATGGQQTRVLKRWYSALTGLLSKPSKAPLSVHNGNNKTQLAVHNLRRSHTAPVFTNDKASVFNQMFKRPSRSPAATDSIVSYENDNGNDNDNQVDDDDGTKYGVTSQEHTLIMTEYCDPLSQFRNFGVKKRYEPNNDSSVLPDNAYLTEKIHRLFGASVEIPSHAIHRVSIHTSSPACPTPAHTVPSASLSPKPCSVENKDADPSESPSLSVYSQNSSPQKAHVEKLASLEEGHWTSAVERCRMERQSQLDLAEKSPKPRISRLYVYPLAYIVIWLPSIVYYIMSTYVYYSAFESPGHHWKKSLDFSGLPGHWTEGQNMNHAWPYLTRITEGVPGSKNIGWMAVIQSLHMLSGAIDAILFWMTE
ncbi:hypothetical protein J3B02_004029 [Coemansia erecta]|nr:hypothetical protein J3B02_004029 [Coemansia erecta]